MSGDAGEVPTTLDAAIHRIAHLSEVIAKLERDNKLMRERLNAMLRRHFGPSSEKFHDPNQLSLFGSAPVESPPTKVSGQEPPKKQREARKGRTSLPEGLKRVQEIVPVPDHDKLCDCCDPAMERAVIGYEVTETLEYKPAALYVKESLREKRACSSGQGSVVTPLIEPRLLPKARVGVSLLVFIMLAKYQDHLPLYRIHKIFKRQGVSIAESTLCDWVGGVTDALAPLVLLMRKFLLRFKYLQADETPAEARDPALNGKNRRVYFWVYSRPWADIVFDYRTTRGSNGPRDFLEGWHDGKLQVDDYVGYDPLFTERPGLVRIGCMAHARRKFKEAEHDRPVACHRILRLLGWAFHIETLMRQKHRLPAERLAVRQRAFRGLFAEIKRRVDDDLGDPTVLPGSPYEKALRYARNGWPALVAFLDDGELEMDNNSVENAIRPFAIGRNNWLHIGHVEAGDRAAVMYSLLATCSRLGINPQDYLTDVMTRIPTHPMADQWALTPRGWLESRSAAAVQLAQSALPEPVPP